MKLTITFILLALALAPLSVAALAEEDLARVKERELEDVRERISELKKSMDATASERDVLTG